LIRYSLVDQLGANSRFTIAGRLAAIRVSAKKMVVNGAVIVEEDPHNRLMAQRGSWRAPDMSQYENETSQAADDMRY